MELRGVRDGEVVEECGDDMLLVLERCTDMRQYVFALFVMLDKEVAVNGLSLWLVADE